MSQYTISLKSIINIRSHEPPYNDDVFNDTAKKLERGREIFFNFEYAGSDDFKRLFENQFLINYFDRDIYCDDIELFMLTIQNEVTERAPRYFAKWNYLNNQIAEIADKIGVIESQTKSNTENKNKSLASQFPQDIKNAEEFSDVRHMDSGGMSEGVGEASAETSSTEYNSKLTHARDYLEVLQNDVIKEFVRSLSDNFMGVL